jgi:hypothetical protein
MIITMNPDEQAIREQVVQRSRLRAENFLPALDVEYEVAMALALARRHAYEAVAEQHDAEWQRIRVAVYAEQRAVRGDPAWPATGGGHGLVHLLAQERFRRHLDEHGVGNVPYPVRSTVVYASDRTG